MPYEADPGTEYATYATSRNAGEQGVRRATSERFGGRHFPASLITSLLLVVFLLVPATGAMAASPRPVNLRTAAGFALLAGSGLTNAGESTVRGDVGSYPTGTVTGFGACPAANCVNLGGKNQGGNAITKAAKRDLVAAYNAAAGRTSALIGTELGGTTVHPGVYEAGSGTFEITGTLTLDGNGNRNAVFIFQAPSTLTTASTSHVALQDGARACNVYWQVGSSATLGTNSTFRGNILAFTSVTVTDHVATRGRILARNGAVTLDTNVVQSPRCA